MGKKFKFEKSVPKNILNQLKDIGHQVEYCESTHGGGQAIHINRKKGILTGGSDSRKDGCAIGY